jgi:hypothetical protein
MFQPDDGLFEMLMEEDLHKLKLTKNEDPTSLSLVISKITIRYKLTLTDSKNTAHILKHGKLHYADGMAAKENPVVERKRGRVPARDS